MSTPYKVKCHNCNAVVINGFATHEQGCTGYLVYTRHGHSFVKYRIFSLDVWGNRRDGFEVNDRSECGQYMVRSTLSDKDVLKTLKRAELLNKKCHFASFRVDGDDRLMVVYSTKDGCPLYQLEAI